MIRTNVIALTIVSVMSLSAMEGDNSQEQSAASYWPLSTSTDFTAMFGASSSVLSSLSGYASTAYRAGATRVYPETIYGLKLNKEQSEIEQKRSRAAVHAANKKLNDLFLSDEENLSEGDTSALQEADNVDNMLFKRLAHLPLTIKTIVERPDTDLTVLDDITVVENSMGSWMPKAFTDVLDRKRRHVVQAIDTRVKQPDMTKSMMIKNPENKPK